MSIQALSPNSILGGATQLNPQARTDTQVSVPQVAQDAQKTVATTKTDTITISAQAVKLAEKKDAVAKEQAKKAGDEQVVQARTDRLVAERTAAQKNAERAYATVSAIQ